MRNTFILLLSISILGCSQHEIDSTNANDEFEKELIRLKNYFEIPGLAVSIEENGRTRYQKYLGWADIDKQLPVDSSTLFPIASITKVFTGVLMMQLLENEDLSLEDTVDQYLEEPVFGDSILIKHVLSHTSQGVVGENFYYSSRFGILTRVIEKSSGKTFKNLINEKIISPLKLDHTFLLEDSTQVSRNNGTIASPYILDNGIENGFIDFGYSSSAGIVSNIDDINIFNRAIDTDILITEKSRNTMFSSFREDLPYGYGIFSQEFGSVTIQWAYGQYDCYSSLLLRVPSKGLTLTLFANNSLLSDPARLINGDATSSLFVINFLDKYVFDSYPAQLAKDHQSDSIKHKLRLRKLLASALADSYMSRFDPSKLDSSKLKLDTIFSEYPNYLEFADINLLHNLAFLKDVAFYLDLGEFNNFDTQIVEIGKKILEEDSNNPYVHSYLGTYYDRKGNLEKSKYHFSKITEARNYTDNWYTREARIWLSNHE